MKRIGFILPIFFSFSMLAQDTLTLSRTQSEAIFLKENLQLLAERLEIEQAEAMVLQAKLWPNPILEVDEVNLWTPKNQRIGLEDELPGFGGGNFGKHQQFSASLEQLILTAGKRKKLIALEEVSVERSKQYFEDLLRHLKFEIRTQLTNLQFLQLKRNVYQSQIETIKLLTTAYQRQMEEGHIAKGEYIRLKALELEILKANKELDEELNEAQKELKLLLRLPSTTVLKITHDGFLKDLVLMETLSLENILKQAMEFRPDFKIANLEERYFQNLYKFEKSQRVPDLNFKVGYDRGSGIYQNFIGFGLAIDIPFFNRNQGNIKSAEIGINKYRLLAEQKELQLENEIVLAYQNLNSAVEFINEIEQDYESTLDDLLTGYTKNFKERNIGLLEYLDFFEAYLDNKEIILESKKEVNERAEELNFIMGTDLIN
jgi:cobalt-zinc-cadmium efflux system outer membrane protein